MKKICKFGIIMMFVIGIILASSITTNAASSGSLYLNNLDFDVQINQDGSMDVTETWDIDISHTNTLFKTFKTDKSKYTSITNVKVSELANSVENSYTEINQEMYHVTDNCYYGLMNSKGEFEIAFGTGMENKSRQTKKYKIKYKVIDAISKNPDCYQLYWQFVGDQFKIDASKINGKIRLPQNAVNKDDIKVWGHTEDLNGEIYVTETNLIEFNIKDFDYGRYVEVRIAMPSYFNMTTNRLDNKSLNDIIQEETVWAEEANKRREMKNFLKTTVGVGTIVLAVFLDWIILKRIKKKKEKITQKTPIYPSNTYRYFREIPDESMSPNMALILKSKNVKELNATTIGNVFSAIILELSLEKLIDFTIVNAGTRKEDVIINILNPNGFTKSREQELVFKFIKTAANNRLQITMNELKRYITYHSHEVVEFKKELDSYTEKVLAVNKYINLEEKKEKEKAESSIFIYIFVMLHTILWFTLLGFLVHPLSLVAGLMILIMLIYGANQSNKLKEACNVFTQKGIDEHEKWKGLQVFMEEFSMMDRKIVVEIKIWEKYLVYATAFGIADKVIAQLKTIYPNIENNAYFNNGTYMHVMMRTNFSSCMSNSISSSMSSAYSSGTGGGGGFSGGGGGGRRPEAAEAAVKICQNI